MAATAMVVAVPHDYARSFCERYGFQRFPDGTYLPKPTIARLPGEREAWSTPFSSRVPVGQPTRATARGRIGQ